MQRCALTVLESAAAFGITDLLMANFARHEAWHSAGRILDVPLFTLAYDFVLRQRHDCGRGDMQALTTAKPRLAVPSSQ